MNLTPEQMQIPCAEDELSDAIKKIGNTIQWAGRWEQSCAGDWWSNIIIRLFDLQAAYLHALDMELPSPEESKEGPHR